MQPTVASRCPEGVDRRTSGSGQVPRSHKAARSTETARPANRQPRHRAPPRRQHRNRAGVQRSRVEAHRPSCRPTTPHLGRDKLVERRRQGLRAETLTGRAASHRTATPVPVRPLTCMFAAQDANWNPAPTPPVNPSKKEAGSNHRRDAPGRAAHQALVARRAPPPADQEHRHPMNPAPNPIACTFCGRPTHHGSQHACCSIERQWGRNDCQGCRNAETERRRWNERQRQAAVGAAGIEPAKSEDTGVTARTRQPTAVTPTPTSIPQQPRPRSRQAASNPRTDAP